MAGGDAAPVLHRLDFRLFWNECDPAGIVYFASWFVWMERTQNEWMVERGLGPDTVQERFGGGFVAAHAATDYISVAKAFISQLSGSNALATLMQSVAEAFDPLSCEMHLARLGAGSVTHGFLLRNRVTGADVARGRITLAWVVAGAAAPLPAPVAHHWASTPT